MIRGTKVLLFLLVVSWTNILSQQVSHQVLVPAAGLITTGSVTYSQTVGETAIEIIGGAGYVFTQGFQQPGIKIEPGEEEKGNGVNVYPNPATDYVNVKLFGDVARKFKIEIINITGTIVSSGTIDFIEKYSYIQQMALGNLKKGFYFVRILSEDGVINRTFKIEKM